MIFGVRIKELDFVISCSTGKELIVILGGAIDWLISGIFVIVGYSVFGINCGKFVRTICSGQIDIISGSDIRIMGGMINLTDLSRFIITSYSMD